MLFKSSNVFDNGNNEEFGNENVSVNTGPWEREGFSTIRKKFNLLPSTIAKVWITP